MILDFKEIPAGNKKGEPKGQFDLFAREFLQLLGYIIVRQPGPGVDGGQDLIVEKAFQRDVGHRREKYLVSCKHYAHRGKAVGVDDDQSIRDRLLRHDCSGFIGFYSTQASNGLYDLLEGGGSPIESQIFDAVNIPKSLLGLSRLQVKSLLLEFLPSSGKIFLQEHFPEPKESTQGNTQCVLTFEKLVEANMTAIILLEIDKIQFAFIGRNWEKTEKGLSDLARFTERNNPTIALRIFDLLIQLAALTRGDMPENVAQSIFSLVADFYTGGDSETDTSNNVLGVLGNEIAFSIVYDATIYLNDLAVAKWGLLIFKYFYMARNHGSTPEIRKDVLKRYKELESTLKRKERSDLGRAQRLVKLFKDDLDVNQLGWPPLPPDLAD